MIDAAAPHRGPWLYELGKEPWAEWTCIVSNRMAWDGEDCEDLGRKLELESLSE